MSLKTFASPQNLQKMRNSFDEFDDDADGEIETQMLEKAIRAYGLNPTSEDIADILSDVSGSNTVSFNTFVFLVYHIGRCSNSLKELIAAFQLFDKDGTGKIPLTVAKDILLKLKRPFTDQQMENLLKTLHVDNGYIDYAELANHMISN